MNNEPQSRVLLHKIFLVCAFILLIIATLALGGVVALTGVFWLVPAGLATWVLSVLVLEL